MNLQSAKNLVKNSEWRRGKITDGMPPNRIFKFSKHKAELFKKEYFNGLLELSTQLNSIQGNIKYENEYEVPQNEIKYWIENGWTFNESENKMQRKGRESVNVKQ